ncbi:hypothetical protein ZIOFF_024278 [Zingiber officinale]|uniref:Integrase catalytic domain-containing protein n=1 Tax=Zingiber officinale TaxID=94328 RepID=A0A8J5H043_ZINOF|nr:hypothetical protein ZIOFF_024278 [Zingiber officinale]
MGVYIAAKNDAFRAFKKFKFLTENKTEYKIRTLRTYRGGEFLSTEFTQFCENEGIERHLTAPYTPQQNGVLERRNRTMMAMTISLLKGERTSFEAWMGRKPHLFHLRVFGCVAYVKNTASHLKKLDDRSSPMVYLGVEEDCKAHRANNEKEVPEFMVVDAFDTDEVIVAADIEAGAEDVITPTIGMVPMTGVSSASTPSLNTHATSSPLITNSPESYEGPVHFRSIADIYVNTEEVVSIDEEEGEIHGEAYNHASQGGQTDFQKHKTVALSSCEAEFMAATIAACHALWLRSLASELTGVKPKPVTLFVDNKSVIALMKNPVFHGRNKHIDTRFHFIIECVENG